MIFILVEMIIKKPELFIIHLEFHVVSINKVEFFTVWI